MQTEFRNIDFEWQLNQNAFNQIVNKFGRPEIDRFASGVNAKCFKYISWKRDSYAFNIDAFTVKWINLIFYAFPPFSMILKVLRKISREEATGIEVVPLWTSQPWFPLYKSLIISETLVFFAK